MSERLIHGRLAMRGRDPHEQGRAATTLELLFDLTFVIAFGLAADEFAHFVAADHVFEGLIGFAFAIFAITWAWINFTWFASAFDTDDWVYRLTTLVQMIGVLVLALGLPDMFASLEHDGPIDNTVMVAGYVVMRAAMIVQWIRASIQCPERRTTCRIMILSLLIAQAGWLVQAIAHLHLGPMLAFAAVLILVELAGPAIAERKEGGTPWHAHHMAERYGLLAIIALGEGLLGTMAVLSAMVGPHGPGWSLDVALIGIAGTSLTFGMWWMYFVVPAAEILHARRERSFGWGYGHIPLFGAIVAMGAGVHVAAYYIEHETELGKLGTILSVAIPVAIFVFAVFALYAQLTRSLDPFHFLLLAVTGAVIGASVLLAATGVSLAWCLVVVSFAPWVTVVGYELVGHRHNEQRLADLHS